MQLTGTEKLVLRFFYKFMSNDCPTTKPKPKMSFKDLF